VVGVNSAYPPYEAAGSDGKPAGFDVDIVRAAAKEVYLDVDFVQGAWSDMRSRLNHHKVDLLAGMLYSPERAQQVEFGASYLTVEYSIFVNKSTRDISSLDDLDDKAVLVERDSQMHELLKQRGISRIMPTTSEPDALLGLERGEGHAALVPLLSGLGMIRERHWTDLRPVGGPLFPRDLCFAAPKGDAQLISRLDTGLTIIRENGQYNSIYRKWFGAPAPAPSPWPGIVRNIAWGAAAVGVVLIFGATWVVMLRKQVRRQTAEIRDSEEKYRTWVELASDGIFVANEEGILVEVNDAICQMTGHKREELIGQPAEMMVDPRDLELKPVRFSVLDDVKSLVTERPFIRKDGTIFPVEVHGKRVGKGVYQGIARDISAHKSAEDQLRRMNEDLELRVQDRTRELQGAYNQLESFSYSVAHDLRAPLRAMNGYATILIRDFDGDLPEDAKDYLTRIGANSQRMAKLIDSLLSYARMSRMDLQKREVSMVQLANEAWQELQTQRGEIEVEIAVHPMPDAFADPMLLKLIYLNLFDNGVKFARKGAGALIEAGFDPDHQAYFVRDNGVGFDPKYKAKLFRVFERLHGPEFEGTGVGLAIVRRIAEQHNGRVWVDGDVGEGATFWFTIGPAS